MVPCRVFQNSKALSQAGLHLEFVKVLGSSLGDQEAAAACCSAIRKLACNDELCSEVARAGAVQMALEVGDAYC